MNALRLVHAARQDVIPHITRNDHPLSTSSTPTISAAVASVPFQPTPASFEERSRKGDDDYVKRPPNAFILYRSWKSKVLTGDGKKYRQVDLNKTIAAQWKALSPEERACWVDLAKTKACEHKMRYPNYRYRPRRVAKNNDSAPAWPPYQAIFSPASGHSHMPTPASFNVSALPSVYPTSFFGTPATVDTAHTASGDHHLGHPHESGSADVSSSSTASADAVLSMGGADFDIECRSEPSLPEIPALDVEMNFGMDEQAMDRDWQALVASWTWAEA
ncbi:hypothetical protein GGX14DRAFT_355339 [Mycena pura]|uniref:HMG box domain-containing protein n=1 Tax=Mycena pura TaxID=153505 RepID=A0AAD6VRZ7_9AGAR|nr:hypothetical protein GGX14DRAFT_355339 [Mycena pura]